MFLPLLTKFTGEIDKKKLPYKENYRTNAINPYEVSKHNCEEICKTYSKNYKQPLIITRSCNLYGPGQLNFSALVPSLIRSNLVNGIFKPRSNGMLTRDYMYIEDWALTLIKIAGKKL